jgi:hypothetical protein
MAKTAAELRAEIQEFLDSNDGSDRRYASAIEPLKRAVSDLASAGSPSSDTPGRRASGGTAEPPPPAEYSPGSRIAAAAGAKPSENRAKAAAAPSPGRKAAMAAKTSDSPSGGSADSAKGRQQLPPFLRKRAKGRATAQKGQ